MAMENDGIDPIKILFVLGIALYILSPVDALPGPIDDIILLMHCITNR